MPVKHDLQHSIIVLMSVENFYVLFAQVRSHGGEHSGAVPANFFWAPQIIQTRKINKFCKCLFSICLIVTPTRNITTRCVKK